MTPEEMLARLLYRDGLMLVIDKPAGFAVHRGPKGGESLEDYFDALRFGLPRNPALAHRLDKDTSGCLVLGRHRKALALLGKLFKQGKIGKTYWAVVEGAPDAEEGRIDIPLGKLDETRGWWMKPDPHGAPAVTTWKVMGRGDGLTWLALEPLTGRTHQLRVHCAEMGLPILGDNIYGRAPRCRRAAAASAFARDRGADFQEQAAGHGHRAGAGAYARGADGVRVERRFQAANNCRPSWPTIVRSRNTPGSTGAASRTAVNCSVWPTPPRSVSTSRRWPTWASRCARNAASPFSRRRRARSLTTARSSCGMRAAGVPGRGENGNTCSCVSPHSSTRSSERANIASVSVGKPAMMSAPNTTSGRSRRTCVAERNGIARAYAGASCA